MISKFTTIFLFIQLFTNVFSDCTVDTSRIPKKKDPIYIKNGILHVPESRMEKNEKIIELKWSIGDTAKLFCNGDDPVNEINFRCGAQNQLVNIDDSQPLDITTITCSNENVPVVEITKTNCGSGTVIQIGFKSATTFYKWFEICYDYKKASVKYTKHIIPGQAFRKRPAPHDRSGIFLVKGLPLYVREGEPYLKDRVKELFSSIFISDKRQSTAVTNLNSYFFARGHLTPVADGVFNSWKRATMLYVNVAPEWQIINACNWRRVENIARAMAYSMNDNLEVITGIAGILKMFNKDTKSEEDLYLTTKTIQNEIIQNRKNNQKRTEGKQQRTDPQDIKVETEENLILVPKYYWKVLKYGKKAIAFVTLNNPYATADTEKDLCTDICKTNGYPTKNEKKPENGFHNFRGGRTYCCEISNFVEKIGVDVPYELKQFDYQVLKYNPNDKEDDVPPAC